MKKFTLTTLTVLGIVLGTTAFAADTGDYSDVDVKVKSMAEKKVELTYLSEGRCSVEVNIYDAKGSKVFTDYVQNGKSFSKAYDMSYLPEGEYSFEIVDKDKVVVEKVKIFSLNAARAEIKKEGDDKFNVAVKGQMANPVAINIYDKYGRLVYGDLIDHGSSFSRTYDLSKSVSKDIVFEVVQDGKVLAKTRF